MTRRTAMAAQIVAREAKERHAVEITTRWIEFVTRNKLAPNLPKAIDKSPLLDRVVAYYCELSTVVRQGRKNNGVLATMAFRGYADLIEEGALRADLLALTQPRLVPEFHDDEERRAWASQIIKQSRRRDNPAKASMLKALRALPSEHLDGRQTSDTMDVVAVEASTRMLDGEEWGAGEEVIGSLHAAIGKEIETFTGPTSGDILASVADHLSRLTLRELQDTIGALKIEDIISIAHVLYPMLAYLAPRITGPEYEQSELEQACMVAAVSMASEISLTGLRALDTFTKDIAAQNPNLRVRAPGVTE